MSTKIDIRNCKGIANNIKLPTIEERQQFEAWLRGETDELPQILKPKPTDTPIEIPPEQDVSNIEPFKSMLGKAWEHLEKRRYKS